MCESLEDVVWLYRGVPAESPDAKDVEFDGEVHPPRQDRVGSDWRYRHVIGDTQTGYTSWTKDRSIAEAAALASADDYRLSGWVRIFRVRIETLDQGRVFEGRSDEDEYLIQGTVESVEFSDDPGNEEDD